MGNGAGFPHRNGFARRADLDDAALRRFLGVCERENEAFCGEAQLGWSRQWEYPFALANLPEVGHRARLLDAGCGYRFFAPLLAQRGFEVHACDLDARIGPQYAEVAAREGLAIAFAREDLSRLRYPDDHFDFICCISVLEHSRDPIAIVREFRRCLKPGGRLLLTFDVSVDGLRDIPIPAAAKLLRSLDRELVPVSPFADDALLDEAALAGADHVLRTGWFRRHEPDRLPWGLLSRALLQNLKRGRFGRPFFDLAVVGVVHAKAD